MKQLHRLVLKSFIGPFILIFFIVLFILLMQFLWRYIDDLVGKGLSFMVIGELLLYTSSSLVPMALPLSILMSSLMTFGNMGEYYELTAIKASGISLRRIMMPLMLFIFLVSIGAFFFANDVLPYTNLKMRSLLYDVRNQRPEIQIMPGSFYNGIDGYSMRVDRKDPNTNMLYDIKIYDHTLRNGNTSVILADSGRMIVTEDERNLIFTLYNGYSYNEVEEERSRKKFRTYPHRLDKFEEQEIYITLVGFALERTDENLFRNHYSMLNLEQLTYMEDSMIRDIDEKAGALQENLLRDNYFKAGKLAYLSTSEQKKVRHNTFDRVIKSHLIEKLPNLPPSGLAAQPADTDSAQTKMDEDPIEIIAAPDTAFYRNLFQQLTLKEQESVLREAAGYARSARTYVVSSSNAIDSKIDLLRRFEIEWHRKFTIAFACFAFLLIGAPLGAIIRKGGLGLPLVLSTLFFIFYYIFSLMGEKFVRESIMPDYQGMWYTSALFFITGVFLTYKATTDAAILNIDTYAKVVRKFIGIKHTSILNQIALKKIPIEAHELKGEMLVHSLITLRDQMEEVQETIENRRSFGGFLLSLTGIREDSNIILLQRLYENTVLRISKTSYFHDRNIKNKLLEMPGFNYKQYMDTQWRLYLKLLLLLIPPITIIVIIRHFMQQYNLKARLKNIDQKVENLLVLIQSSEDFERSKA